jgi:hypothetical protein
MRRLLSPAILGAAVLGTLIVPEGLPAAEKPPEPVVVTNVPLVVTIPRPFVGQELYTFFDGQFQASGPTFSAPANSLIETISIHVLVPAGQKPSAMMVVPGDSGQIGNLEVPLQFQRTNVSGHEVYVGTVTNAHVPMGDTAASQQVDFAISRDSHFGIGNASVTVIGVPGPP